MVALVDLATDEPLARFALDVILELEVAAAEQAGGLRHPTVEGEARLEEFVRVMVQTRP